ncbi:ParB/RepB/Spo0J family partition protein [Streptomyces griseoviridis]|uniref:ParB/RepB/Spo0J family partition protein n=1 Tax=Streptomyces griseoviridis TaxID=45398 RepID=UPI0034051D49
MAEITITHTRADGTLLDGSSKGDGVYEIVQKHGFRWSRTVGIYIRGSRDKEAQHWRISGAADALRAAGHEVTIEIDEDDDRSFTEIETEREERAEDRADRFGGRAGRAAASSEARRATARNISRRFEFGQPILVGHHSERGARRDQERIHDNMRKSIEADERAGYWANRAEAAAAYKKHRNDPYRTLRRLEKLRAELRQQRRHHAEAVEKGYASVDRHARNIRDLEREIGGWEGVVEKAKAEGVKIWGPDDFAAGDYVLYSGSWYQVHRVNPKTLSIAWNLRLAPKQVMTLEDATDRGRVWTHPADYTNARARCPEAAMTVFLADGTVPGTKLAQTASEKEPASAVREAQSAATKAKPKKKGDPKVAKRLFVTCDLDGTVAELTWLNGNSRPHKDFETTLIMPPEGERFRRAVWSKALHEEIAKKLDERGYTYGQGDWTVSRDRSGWVRDIKPTPREVPEAEQPAEAAPVNEEPPAKALVSESAAAAEEPATATAEEGAETPAGVEKTSLTCENSGDTRNHADVSGVVHSDSPLTVTPEEGAVTEEEQCGRKLTRRERHEAQVAEACERAAQRPEVERTAELDDAYRRYVDDGIASTDGWFAPLDFQGWATTLGAHLVTAAAADAPAVEEQVRPVTEAAAEAEEAPSMEVEESSGGAEKTSLTCENSGNNRNHVDVSGVVHSDSPLLPTSQEAPTMTITAPAKKATTPAKAAKGAAKAKPAKKAPAKSKAVVRKVVEPTAVATAAEVREEKSPTHGQKTIQRKVPIDRIDRDATQPREEFDQGKLEELAGSMRKLGQLQPVMLRYFPATRRYTLIMGERRWRAAAMAGLTKLDAVVVSGVADGDRETLAKQVAENVGRADMTPMEEAKSFKRLEDAEYTIDEIAEMCGKSAAYIGWRIDLLKLCEEAQEALSKAHLPVGMAWYVSKLSCENQMRFLAKYARGHFANDRAAEEFVKACLAEEKRRESQGSFFVLAGEDEEVDGGTQEGIPGAHDVSEDERERIMDERAKLTKKIDRLSSAGEILSELATADPEELALLLAGTPGGVPGHQMRMDHLAKLIGKVGANLRKAQAHAEVRASGIVVNPEVTA